MTKSLAHSPLEHAARSGPEDVCAGQTLGGQYAIVRRLSAGGMGTVYEARDTSSGERFAIKLLHAEHLHHPRVVRRFLREATIVSSLASPHIVAVRASGDFSGRPYIVMELLQGQDLRELLAEFGCLPLPRALGLVQDVAMGLIAAHRAGLVHRDLKPANIFITRGPAGRELAKVLDFGVAKLRGTGDSTGEGTLIGTLGYMAPEQIVSGKDVDAKTDVYALGLILYEVLAGERPHRGEKAELLYNIVHVDPPSLDTQRPHLPKGLAGVVAKAMARDPAQRYTSIGELAAALRAFEDGTEAWLDASTARARRAKPAPQLSTHRDTTDASEVPAARLPSRDEEPASLTWLRWVGAGLLGGLLLLGDARQLQRGGREPVSPRADVKSLTAESAVPRPAPLAVPGARSERRSVAPNVEPSMPSAVPAGLPSAPPSPRRPDPLEARRRTAPRHTPEIPSPGSLFDGRNPYATR